MMRRFGLACMLVAFTLVVSNSWTAYLMSDTMAVGTVPFDVTTIYGLKRDWAGGRANCVPWTYCTAFQAPFDWMF